ncbi:MAG: translation elongation factor Ts [Chloroflexota bacterium]
MAISTAMIKELREATGAGILDSKKALESSEGDLDRAIEILREKGLAKAGKKASREANDGLVIAKMSDDRKRASLVAVNCETDFVARTEDFGAFSNSVAQQYLDDDSLNSVEDLLNANYGDSGKTVSDAIQDTISKLGENILVKQAERYVLEGEGVIDAYIHLNNQLGVLVEVSTDNAVSDQDALVELAHDVALQITAVNPAYLSPDDVPENLIEEERKILLAQLADDNKPDNIKEKIVEGRLKKFYTENCLLEQEFVKDGSLTINKLLQQSGKSLGATISIRRYARFALGES